jgi:uncharacterized protein DUF1707
MSEPNMRAADSDRAAVAAALGRHMADGRLTVEEYEERVGRAYAARTYGELAGLTTDLPSSGLPTPAPRPVPRPLYASSCGAGWYSYRRGRLWAGWMTMVLFVTAIWLVASIVGGTAIHVWPFWLIFWGFFMLRRPFGRAGGRSHPRRRLPG